MLTPCPHCGNQLDVQIVAVADDGTMTRRYQPGQRVVEAANHVARYLEERTTGSADARTPMPSLQADLSNWWRENGLGEPSPRTLGRALTLNGVQRSKSSGRKYYLGVELRA